MLTAGCDAVLYKPYNEAEIFNAMGEQLGLHYIYQAPSELLNQETLSKLCLGNLQELPDAWLDEFLTAARIGDTEAMLSLTNTLDAEYAETKTKLNNCINDFQLQYLLRLLEEKTGTTKNIIT